MTIGFLLISFIAGVLTVLAPCILPLLPVIVGGSVDGTSDRRTATTIVAALGVSVVVFTLILKVSTAFIGIPALFWQIVSGGLLIFVGAVGLMPTWWDRIPVVNRVYRASNKLLGGGYQKRSFGGNIIVGAALGPVFTSCSPTYFVILATVLPANFAAGLVYLLAYALGLCLFMFVVAYAGGRLAAKLGVAADPHGRFKKVVSILFIVVGLAILFGIDKKIEASLPGGAFGEIGWEQYLLSSHSGTGGAAHPIGQNGSDTVSAGTSTASSAGFLTLAEKTLRYSKAPELVDPAGYVNTGGKPITLGQFKGHKVVLIDFWDYSCINCQRTIPYLNAWYNKYKDQGLVVIGVHTPEFAFEKLESNVEAATQQFGITYPVVLDNEYRTWNAFQNQFWPREYLVDIDGYIVHDHAGEGDYDATEQAIRQALAERAARLGTTTPAMPATVTVPVPDLSGIGSPETYFGADRNMYLGNGTQGQSGIQVLAIPAIIQPNTLYLGGSWNFMPEYAEAGPGATVEFEYSSRDVYMVATNPAASAIVKVFRDGKLVGTFGGTDVDPTSSTVHVNGDRLYRLIHDPTPGVHTIKLQIEQGTLDAYTFTFG
jgi:cytochrome c biogenesis protein CcdA/thiol-disulfide isomerase/thioredoxin